MAATPGARVGVLRFDQAQPDQSPVLIRSLDRVAVQLEFADHGRWGIKPSRAQRRKRHRPLTSTTQLLKRQTMLSLNERHRTELSTLRPCRSRVPHAPTASPSPAPARAIADRYRAFMTGRRALSGFRSAATAPSEQATAPRAVRSQPPGNKRSEPPAGGGRIGSPHVRSRTTSSEYAIGRQAPAHCVTGGQLMRSGRSSRKLCWGSLRKPARERRRSGFGARMRAARRSTRPS